MGHETVCKWNGEWHEGKTAKGRKNENDAAVVAAAPGYTISKYFIYLILIIYIRIITIITQKPTLKNKNNERT